MRLRDYTPRGYKARHILILIVPMLIFVISMTIYFFGGHVREVNAKLSRGVAKEIGALIDLHETTPNLYPTLVETYANADLMTVTYTPGATELIRPPGNTCCNALKQELENHVGRDAVYSARPDGLMTIRIRGNDGIFNATLERKRVVIITAHIFIVWSVLYCVLLVIMAYAFLRNQVRSIMQLTHAADAFGRGEDAPNYRPSGALEIRQAARSIIRMRNRIMRYTNQRAAMLAGVSHDLRTPLTRLKLELAMLPKENDLSAAREDIAEMERMLDEYLAFAKGEEGEKSVDADLSQIAQEATNHLKDRVDLEFKSIGPIPMRLRRLGIKRAITNLANNAADHADKVRVTIKKESESVSINIEDNGPGIPEDLRADAFRPFSRLDASRNQNVSGVGLGLTIARDTARAHGGDVTLSDSELGGLTATIQLPLAPEPS